MAISFAWVLAFEAAGVGNGGEMTTPAPGVKLDPIRERRTLCAPCETRPGPTLVRMGGETGGGAGVTRNGWGAVTGFPAVPKVTMTDCGPVGALPAMETVAVTRPIALDCCVTVTPIPGLNCRPTAGNWQEPERLAVNLKTAPCTAEVGVKDVTPHCACAATGTSSTPKHKTAMNRTSNRYLHWPCRRKQRLRAQC